jgi:hypothetical protein
MPVMVPEQGKNSAPAAAQQQHSSMNRRRLRSPLATAAGARTGGARSLTDVLARLSAAEIAGLVALGRPVCNACGDFSPPPHLKLPAQEQRRVPAASRHSLCAEHQKHPVTLEHWLQLPFAPPNGPHSALSPTPAAPATHGDSAPSATPDPRAPAAGSCANDRDRDLQHEHDNSQHHRAESPRQPR